MKTNAILHFISFSNFKVFRHIKALFGKPQKSVLAKKLLSPTVQSLLSEKMDMTKRMAQMCHTLGSNKEALKKRTAQYINIIGYDMLDWDYIFPTINALYYGFVDKIRQKFTTMTEKNIKLCCLIRAGFSNSEIANLLSYTEGSVRVAKNYLWKKLKYKSFQDFVIEMQKL